MFGAIGGVLGRVFGTDKAAESLVNNVAKGFDKLVYTKEEQAEDNARSVTEARTMVVDWMKATSGQNLARRFIAMSITAVWLFQYVVMVVMSGVTPFVSVVTSEKLMASAALIGEYAQKMNGAMMLILAFYFAAPHMGSMVKGAMDKFSNSK